MPKILYVMPSLEYCGAAKQIGLLVQGLPRNEFEPRVCAVGDDGPAAGRFRAAGVRVDVLGGTRLFNLAALWRLRRLVRDFRPDMIHTWGQPSLRAVALAAGRKTCPWLASAPLPARPGNPPPGRLDRWLLHRVDRILAAGTTEANCYRHFGLPPGKIQVVPPGVESCSAERGARGAGPSAQCSALHAPRFILCAGPLVPHKGFLDAIWSFDILQFLYDDLHLVLAGAGSDRPRLERFAELTGAGRRVHFAGTQSDMSRLLTQAEMVWVPSRAEGGVNIALEAMAHGRPVVASRLPGLAEIIVGGQTGLLVTPGNKVELARQTRLLLDSPDQRRQLSEAARRRAATHFAAAALVRRCAELYRAPGRAA